MSNIIIYIGIVFLLTLSTITIKNVVSVEREEKDSHKSSMEEALKHIKHMEDK